MNPFSFIEIFEPSMEFEFRNYMEQVYNADHFDNFFKKLLFTNIL